MKRMFAAKWLLLVVIPMSVCMTRCLCLRRANQKTTSLLSTSSSRPLLVEEDEPYANSVRVLADAIKRQAWRNVRAGHDLVKRKAEEFKKHQKSHTDSFSAKIEGLEQQLQEVTEKAEAAEEDIDKERMRHAKAKEHILQDAEDAILSLREKENASIEQQHRAEEKIAEAEEQLKHEQAELRAATRRHQQLLDSEQQREQQVEELIAKEKQEELEDEEAAEAREEAAEADA